MKTTQICLGVNSITCAQRALQLCFVLTLGLLLSACQQEGKIAKTDPTGVYVLASVNGSKIPASISHEGTALQVRSGAFTIKADGTCSTKTVFVPPSGSEVAREVSATYTQEGPCQCMVSLGPSCV